MTELEELLMEQLRELEKAEKNRLSQEKEREELLAQLLFKIIQQNNQIIEVLSSIGNKENESKEEEDLEELLRSLFESLSNNFTNSLNKLTEQLKSLKQG